MDRDVFREILQTELGAQEEEGRWRLPHGTRLNVFLATGDSVFPVPKVDEVVFHDHYLVLESDEGRTFTALTQIVAVSANEEGHKRPDSRVGFG